MDKKEVTLRTKIENTQLEFEHAQNNLRQAERELMRYQAVELIFEEIDHVVSKKETAFQCSLQGDVLVLVRSQGVPPLQETAWREPLDELDMRAIGAEGCLELLWTSLQMRGAKKLLVRTFDMRERIRCENAEQVAQAIRQGGLPEIDNLLEWEFSAPTNALSNP